MQKQSGNLLLQTLLALGVVFAFLPFLTGRLAMRDSDARMYAATNQIELAQTAARLFVRENADALAYDRTIITGNSFADMLEPYGLPLGYVPKTALDQDIALIIEKTPVAISAYLEITGGDLNGVRRAELARRIGFYASATETGIQVGIPLDAIYSDVVRRNETDADSGAFLTDLDMGDFVFDNVGRLYARRGEFETAQFGTLAISGTENGRKVRNQIKNMNATKTIFQSRTGESALSLTRGTLSADGVVARSIASVGDTGNLTVADASVYDFEMTAGRTGFTGPVNWNVRGNVISDRMNFSVERLDIDSYLNVSRGQDVYVNLDDLEYSTRSGLEVGKIAAANITMRDQTSNALISGGAGAVVLDIRVSGTSLLPDALVDTINNDGMAILARPGDNGADMVDCRNIVTAMGKRYDQKSLSQYLVCQYVYWQRLERRIDIKQCLMAGRSDCK